MSNARQYEKLVEKYRDNTASEEELELFFYLLQEGKLAVHIDAQMQEQLEAVQPVTPQVHRVHFLKTAWFRYAAAVIIILGTAGYLWNIQYEKRETRDEQSVPYAKQEQDVAPGGNRAMLTLSDGRKIVLDDAKSGELAKEENATITKSADGKIVYDPNEKPGNKVLFNTMTTPRGGQYQLTLPDGTQVWLNAESSITYPTAFTGKERKVSITGEAYFEVTKDAKRPFLVTVTRSILSHPERSEGSLNDQMQIEVLGTHFNVNVYPNEPTQSITLLEGSVKLTSHRSLLTSVHTSLILRPGQQGQLDPAKNKLSLAAKPDIEQVMAWRRGLFDFNNKSLKETMNQLSRWYDVDVVYEGTIPNVTFGGKAQRNLNLSQVMRGLSAMGVKFRIEGKKLIVTQ